jgi:hypothetical protein
MPTQNDYMYFPPIDVVDPSEENMYWGDTLRTGTCMHVSFLAATHEKAAYMYFYIIAPNPLCCILLPMSLCIFHSPPFCFLSKAGT